MAVGAKEGLGELSFGHSTLLLEVRLDVRFDGGPAVNPSLAGVGFRDTGVGDGAEALSVSNPLSQSRHR